MFYFLSRQLGFKALKTLLYLILNNKTLFISKVGSLDSKLKWKNHTDLFHKQVNKRLSLKTKNF